MSKFSNIASKVSVSLCIVGAFYVLSDFRMPNASAQQQSSEVQIGNDQTHVTIDFVNQGLKAREEAVEKIKACWISVMYSHDSPSITQAQKSYPNPSLAMQLSLQTPNLPPRTWQCLWLADGSKGRYQIRPGIGWPQQQVSPISAYDGEKLQQWYFGSGVATEDAHLGRWAGGFGDDGASLFQLALGPKPYKFSEVLKEKNAEIEGWEKLGDVECIKLHASSGGENYLWWVAPSLDFMLVRSELRAQNSPTSPIKGWRYIEMVDKVTKRSGVWMPLVKRHLKVLSVNKIDSDEVEEVWSGLQRDVTLDLKINEPLSPKNFEIMLPPGTQVGRDPALGENYVVEGDAKEYRDKLKEAQAKDEQPDIDACDFSKIEEEVKTGKIKPEYVSDHVDHIALETPAEPEKAAK